MQNISSLRYEPYYTKELYMTDKEVQSIEHLEYEDGSKIKGTDIQRVFNYQLMFQQKFNVNITVATAWKTILYNDAKARELKVCSVDNKDDCEACGS